MGTRQFIFGLVLVIPGVWLLIAPKSKEALPPADAVVVEYWEKWTGLEAERMKAVVDEYNRTVGRSKGIFVRYISMSSIDRKMLISTAGGAPPDIAGIWSDQVGQFVSQDAFHPLDELAAEYNSPEKDYKATLAKTCHYEGKLYALISSCASIGLQYNRTIFWENADKLRAAGLDPTRGPETIAELDRYAQALDILQPNGQLARAGYLPSEPGWYTIHTGLWFGTELYDPRRDVFLLDSPKSIQAMNWFQGYSKRLGPQTANNFKSGFGDFATAGNPFVIGKVAMIQQGPWLPLYLENFTPEVNRLIVPKNLETLLPLCMRTCNYSWVLQAFPSVSRDLKDVAFTPADILCIPKGAKHKREAFDFMAYLNRPEVMERLEMSRCAMSPFKTTSRRFIAFHPNPYIEVIERIGSSPNAHSEPQTPVYREVTSDLNAMMTRISLLDIEVETGMRELQTESMRKLQVFEEKQKARKGTGRE